MGLATLCNLTEEVRSGVCLSRNFPRGARIPEHRLQTRLHSRWGRDRAGSASPRSAGPLGLSLPWKSRQLGGWHGRCGGQGAGASRTNFRPSGSCCSWGCLCLKVLVDLGHILHHTLPIRPVRVQHLTELLQRRELQSRGTRFY